MATAIKLKKSSVAGKIPAAGDLAYGELAINYQDGKLFYKDASNNVKAFLDSANSYTLIQNHSIDSADALILIQNNSVDSAEVINLIDSDYITARVGEVGIDSAAVTALIDSDYVQARSSAIADVNTVVLDTFTGDSSTTAFVLTKAPTAEQHAFVTINGVTQQTDAYTLSGATLTLSEAPISNDAIEVRTLRMQTGVVTLRDYASYVYQPSTSTSTFSGADANGNTLTYDVAKLDVYFNGARLVNNLDYTATNGSSITLLGTPATSGDTIEISSYAAASITDETSSITLSTTASNQAVTSFNKTTYRTAKYIVQMSQNSRYHSQEVLLIHDGTTVHMVEYADIYTESDLGTVDADISGDAVRLLVTPNYTNTTVKTNRTEVAV